MLDLSIVVPVYNEEETVETLCERLHQEVSAIGKAYEIILVDDGSRDRTWELMGQCAQKYPNFVLVRFRRNFGQTAAMSAGFKESRGEVVITLDADLQNDPKDIPKLLERLTDDVDVVSGWRKDRKDNVIRRIPSRLANRLISKITGVHLHDYGCTLKAYRSNVIKDVKLYGEMHRFIPALAHWVGGRVDEAVVTHHPRLAGEAKYGKFALGRTFRVILDLITVKFLMRYALGPMQIFGKIGGFFGLLGLFLFGVMFFDFFFINHETGTQLFKRPFWVMSAFMFILFCIQFISMGLLAEIQIRTYHEAQDKETYVVREIIR